MPTTRQSERELRASRRLMSVAEWEIQQLLLDLHDGPVQYMYAALSQLDLLRRALDAETLEARAQVADRLDRIQHLLESGLGDVRGFIGAFRAPEFGTRPLLEVLETLVVQHEAATDLEVTLEGEGALPEADLPIKIALYRVLQEALSNAYRHGGASRAAVRLAPAAGSAIRMTVGDDGAGFDPGAIEPQRRFGLQGMQDRVEMVGGTFRIRSSPGAGTTVTVEVPAA